MPRIISQRGAAKQKATHDAPKNMVIYILRRLSFDNVAHLEEVKKTKRAVLLSSKFVSVFIKSTGRWLLGAKPRWWVLWRTR